MDPFPMTTADLASHNADLARRHASALEERVTQLEEMQAAFKADFERILRENVIEILDASEAARERGEDPVAAMDAKLAEQTARARRIAAEIGVPFED